MNNNLIASNITILNAFVKNGFLKRCEIHFRMVKIIVHNFTELQLYKFYMFVLKITRMLGLLGLFTGISVVLYWLT